MVETAAILAWTLQKEIPTPADVSETARRGRDRGRVLQDLPRLGHVHHEAAHRP